MIKIGLLSDTHGWWDDKYAEYFSVCDEIWHAGDIGSEEVADKLTAIKPLRAVFGNIDGNPLRRRFPSVAHFTVEQTTVLMTHIGGYPNHYTSTVRDDLYRLRPQLFISGHSHILKVIYDKKFNCLHINPGAAGISGFHTVRTLVRFTIDLAEIKDLEIIEMSRDNSIIDY